MMETISMMSLGQKSRFLMLGPCSSSGSSSLAWIRTPFEMHEGVNHVWMQRESWTHRVRRLVLSAVQLLAVVEDVVICGVEAGLDAVPHHLAGSGWRLKLLDLNTEEQKIRLGLSLSRGEDGPIPSF